MATAQAAPLPPRRRPARAIARLPQSESPGEALDFEEIEASSAGLAAVEPAAREGVPREGQAREARTADRRALGARPMSLRKVAAESAGDWMRPMIDRLDEAVSETGEVEAFQRDPRTIERLRPMLDATSRWLGARVRGFERIPRDEPVLIVGNHSGGAMTLDPVPLFARWIEERGVDDPLYFLSYQLLFAYPGMGPLIRRMGGLPAGHENAHAALARGGSVLVFPGGDYEVFRPWRERNQIAFGERTGFVRLALEAGIRVVPMTIHGAHESTFVLTRGHRIARAMGLERLRIKVFPLVWNLPFGLTPAYVPSMPIPSTVTVELGEPIDWRSLGAEAARDPAVVARCRDEVVATMQATMDRLAAENPQPVLRRLNALRPTRVAARAWRGLRG